MKLYGSLTELVSAIFRRSTPNNTITVQPGTNTANAGNVVFNLPPLTTGTSTIVDTDSSQQLSNKQLNAPIVVAGDLEGATTISDLGYIYDNSDGTKRLAFDPAGTTGTTTTLRSAPTVTGRVVTLPDATTTLVGRDTTDTLTNKTLTSPTITGAALSGASSATDAFTINDASDATKQLGFDAAGTTSTKTTLQTSQTTNRTVTLPDATDTLVGKATTDTLTNKTLSAPAITGSSTIIDSMTLLDNVDNTKIQRLDVSSAQTTGTTRTQTLPITSGNLLNDTNTITIVQNKNFEDTTTKIVDTADQTIKIGFDAAGTSGTTLTLKGVQTANDTITFPLGTDTLVNLTSTQSLTNKSLVDSGSHIVDSGDNTKKLDFDVQGTTGTTLTLQTAQTTNRTLILPDATDTLVGKATTDTLTNKTLTSPTLNTPVLGSYQDLTEIATPATPGAGVLRLYSKSGDVLAYKNSAGTETQVATTAVATPTSQGTTTSYFATIQSSVLTTTNANATSTTTDGYETYLFSTGNTNRTLTLPAASANAGRVMIVKKTDSGTGLVTITRAGSDTIDGATTLVLTSQYDSVTLVCDGSAAWNRAGDPAATSTVSGNVSTATQSLAGFKTFTSGSSSPANIRAADSTDVTLTTTDNRVQVFAQSASINVTLPTTNVLAGDTFTMYGTSSTFALTFKASGGTTFTSSNGATGSVGDPTIRFGRVMFVATTATPTTPGGWLVAEIDEQETSASTSFSWDGTGGASSTTSAIVLTRRNQQVTLRIPQTLVNTRTSSTAFTSTAGAVPSRFRPTNTVEFWALVRDNAGATPSQQNQPGRCTISSAGTIVLYKDATTTATFTNTASGGFLAGNTMITYMNNE